MTPERFTNLDEWSQALEPGPCKTALRELVEHVIERREHLLEEYDAWNAEFQKCAAERDELRAKLVELTTDREALGERLRMAVQYGKGASETIYQHGVRIVRLCRRVARWKHVAAEYKRRFRATKVLLVIVTDQRDTLRKRVAVLEQRLDDVPCGWTEPVPDYPRKRLTAKSVPDRGAQ